MREAPKCPYCGDRMELRIAPDCINKTASAWYRCVVCDSTSPTIECPMYDDGKQAGKRALELALRRVEPENRVLTLAEAEKKCQEDRITWYEPFRHESKIVFPVYISPIDPSDMLADIYAFLADTRKEVALYGKTWRCWLKKPTPKEMEATPWES